MKFTHVSLPQRVTFASGEAPAAVATEIAALGGSKVMLIASERDRMRVDPIADEVPVVLRFEDVVMHVPIEVAARARAAAAASGADVVVSVGGGSSTGLAKAVTLATGLPIVAVPTTYAGSEATNVWGLTDNGIKTTGVDPRVLPASIVYDAALLTSLPGDMTVASGLNAMAHCIDSMWAPHTDPIDQAWAGEGIRSLATGLPKVATEPQDIAAIEQTLYGAYLAAVAFSSAGSGMHHKICHVLGGRFNLPHAPTHAIVLPHVLAFNAPYASEAAHRIATALGTSNASQGLRALYTTLNAPTALNDYGMPENEIEDVLAPILRVIPENNPAPVTEESLAALLKAACEGDLP